MDGLRPDPFSDPLESLSYESIYEAFRNVGSERMRLEFKESLDAEELARQTVAMANGNGGLVIVGFKDPVEGQALEPSNFAGEIDEPARRGLQSRIQTKVYPSLPIDLAGFVSRDGLRRLLLVRVEPSDAAPHELVNARGRFLVRRGTEVSGMTLRELEVQIRQRDTAPRGFDLDDLDAARNPRGSGGLISFDQGVPERFVGATLYPETIQRSEPLSRSLQKKIERIVTRLDNLNAASPVTYADGVLFEYSRTVPDGATVPDEHAFRRYSQVAYVGSDGSAEIRFQLNNTAYREALVRIICTIYALGTQALLTLGLGPRASGSIVLHRGHPSDAEPHQPAGGNHPFYVNFATDTVELMARRPLMYALRQAGVLMDPDDSDAEVAKQWNFAYHALGDSRSAWQ